MKIRKAHLERAEQAGALAPGGATALWENLSLQLAEEPAFRAQHLLYYFGAMMMLLPFTIFVSLGILKIGVAGLLVVALLVGGATFLAAEKLLAMGLRIAAGTFSVVSLGMVPLAVHALLSLAGVEFPKDYADFHRSIRAEYITIEVATLAASVYYLYRHRLPFLMLPVSVILWYLGMDLSTGIFGYAYGSTFRNWSLGYGLFLLAVAYAVERRTRHTLSDYSFWLWLFGTLTFWGALTSMDSGSEWGKAVYALINLGLVAGSVLVHRRVLAVAGAVGLTMYLGHLSMKVFRDAALFPLVTLVAGAAVVWVGLKWPAIEARLANALGVKPKKTAA